MNAVLSDGSIITPINNFFAFYYSGSENSLLNMTDEDMWLRKGMDEDGSFRQVYIKE